ncbi:MAG: 50S ribosomal protein L25/general stress protein Ctc [Cardiobacteriaceae bacterium]|nr:50S ribosomal protein L25/general stress protein Ctc [Cardiobacteriaceae bacterium]
MSKYAYTLNANVRQDNGKGASRRLRREGLVPAIVYGGEEQPLSIAVKQDDLGKYGRFDSFYSQIICLKVENQGDIEVIVRDVQRHLYKPLYQHMDFQRIVRGQELQATISLHFTNEEISKGVKLEGGIVEHHLNSVDIICLPRDLPEYIEVDMADVSLGQVIHLRDLKLPQGVRLVHDDERADAVVAQIVHPQLVVDTESDSTDTIADNDTPEDSGAASE